MSGHRPVFKPKSSPDRVVAEPIETSFAKVVGLIERALRMRPFFEAYNAADKKVTALLTQLPWTQNLSTVIRAVCAKDALKCSICPPIPELSTVSWSQSPWLPTACVGTFAPSTLSTPDSATLIGHMQ